MSKPLHAAVERYQEGGQPRLKLRGRLDRHSAPAVYDWLQAWLPTDGRPVGLDLGELEFLDSAGVAVLTEAQRQAGRRGVRLELVKVSEPARRTLSLFRTAEEGGDWQVLRAGLLERTGQGAWQVLQEWKAMFLLLVDTFYWAVLGPFLGGRGAPRGEMMRQSILLGSNAFGIISLLSFLIGLTMALLSAHQLRRFGANIYVADLVAVAMVRELGPILTAVIVAGRSGSAIAAEIATMRVTEEIDALLAMGFVPVRFLVVPKMYAVTLTQPLLTFVGVAFGIFGGLVIAALSLGVPPQPFLHQALGAIRPTDIGSGLMKSVVFGWLILLIAAHCGLRTRGGAEAVGLSTTRSVVLAIFSVIIADCIFSLALYL
ncbi:MAG: ABC transporter [Deltaproteobacteria bacterium]|nr:MAG: ABC transporter [Deltaproteobacteria bacterium]